MTLLFAARTLLMIYQGNTREKLEPVTIGAHLDYADRSPVDSNFVKSRLCKFYLPFGIVPVLYVGRVSA
jgi:hypothetical protein